MRDTDLVNDVFRTDLFLTFFLLNSSGIPQVLYYKPCDALVIPGYKHGSTSFEVECYKRPFLKYAHDGEERDKYGPIAFAMCPDCKRSSILNFISKSIYVLTRFLLRFPMNYNISLLHA